MNHKLAYKDFTIKAKLNDIAKMEEKLAKLKATFAGVDDQLDTYFSVPKGKLKLRVGTIENLITKYERVMDKGLERTIVYQYDLNPSTEQVSKLYRDYAVVGKVEKQREIYRLDNIKIHLDKTPGNETFIEIEAIDSTDCRSVEELRRQCLEVKERLGISDDDLMKTGYFTEES